jgi:DNA invertase Pin-like site-specific DNA recombinase
MAPSGNFGYRRVSSTDQSTGRQLQDMEFDHVYEDKCSGKDTARPALQEALRSLRKGDTFTAHSMDRLARSLADLLTLVTDLTARGVTVIFVKEHLTFTGNDSAIDKLLLSMLGAVAEFERQLIRQRQREGIDLALAEGRYKGRPRVLTPSMVEEARRLKAEGENVVDIAEQLGCSRQTLYTALKSQTA